MSRLRLGVVPYLNVAPIIHGLRDDPEVTLVREVPARLRSLLVAGEVDAATLPSIDYATLDGCRIVPGVAIGSRGAVRSVRLFHRKPLTEVRTAAVDTSSHTSVALLRVLLHARPEGEPEYVPAAPDLPGMLGEADAALLIGDAALYAGDPCASLDLGEEWTRRTGLPFVFAFWVAPDGRLGPGDVERLRGSLAAGLEAVEAIASSYNSDGSRRRENEAYLRSHVSYALGEDEQQGVTEFYRRAHALGLVPRAPELRFHGDS